MRPRKNLSGHAALHRFEFVARPHAPLAFEQLFLPLLRRGSRGFGYYTPARFREVKVHVRLLALWRWLGFEFLVNHFPRFRRFWEYYLCYLVRGKVMEFEFEAIK